MNHQNNGFGFPEEEEVHLVSGCMLPTQSPSRCGSNEEKTNPPIIFQENS